MSATLTRSQIRVDAYTEDPLAEDGHATTLWHFERYDAEQVAWGRKRLERCGIIREPVHGDFRRLGVRPFNCTEHKGNLVTNAGWTRLMNLLTNQGSTQAYDATHTRIGVGDGTTAVAYTDTDLSAAAGSTHRLFNLVTGAGSLGTRTLAWTATFATGDANFAAAWAEFGIDQGTAQGNTVTAPLLNHALTTQGIKPSSQVWSATATLTFS